MDTVVAVLALLFTLDADLVGIVGLSLRVSLLEVFFAALVAALASTAARRFLNGEL